MREVSHGFSYSIRHQRFGPCSGPHAHQYHFHVSDPDINVVEEMANLMTAQRNYEANVTTAEALKGMYVKALEIGK